MIIQRLAECGKPGKGKSAFSLKSCDKQCDFIKKIFY